MQVYPSDLTDSQWELIREFIPNARRGGRPRSTDARQVVNALFYLNRSGCAWRYLPKQNGFPPWKTVYDYFSQWRASGIWKRIHNFLVSEVRRSVGKKESASTLIVDAQSIKAPSGAHRGYDGFKKVKGRKRSLFVDTLGLIHSVKVDAANRRDDQSALEMLKPNQAYFPDSIVENLSAFYADGGYKAHDFQNAVKRQWQIWPTLKSSKSKMEFKTLADQGYKKIYTVTESNLKPVRWIVERTFAWFNHYRRLTKDYERKTIYSETMIHLAMIQLMLKRLSLAPKP